MVAVFFAAFAGGAFSATFLAAAFFRAAFLAALSCCALAALTLAHRAFVAAIILALPALLIRRLGFVDFGVAGAVGSAAFFDAAHLFRCASAIAFRPAALIFRRLRFVGSGVAAVCVEPPGSIARSSAILVSIWRFCCSKPRMAALMISGVSFCVGMSAFRTNYGSAFHGQERALPWVAFQREGS